MNIVSKCRFVFSLYLNIRRLRTGPGKLFAGSWKVLDFFVSRRVGTPQIKQNHLCTHNVT